MTKKSQITMFVILGLVVLIIFLVILSMKRLVQSNKISAQDFLNELDAGSIKNHISQCISEVAMDGIEKLGANGGVIYDFQDGNIVFNEMLVGKDYLNYTNNGKTFFVAYGLRKNSLCNQLDYSLPNYPADGKTFDELGLLYEQNCRFDSVSAYYDGFFGQNVMNKLCYLAKDSGCESFAKGMDMGMTMQKQLEDYVKKKLPGCLNLSAFVDRMPVGSNIIPEAEPRVDVSIHSSDIVLMVNYPIKISFEDQEPISKLLTYDVTMNARVGGVYNFMYNLLSSDSKNLMFNIEKDYLSSHYYMQGFEVERIRNPCEECGLPFKEDDVLEVIDRKSLINGKPFTFRVVIENRQPAIDMIPDVNIDVAAHPDTSVKFQAIDPDDGPMKSFFISVGIGSPYCQGKSFSLGSFGWCEKNSIIQTSLPYSVLSFVLSSMDVGEHEVGVLAADDSGLFDYQLFRVTVADGSANNPAEPLICVAVCEADGKTAEECEKICKIANNQCQSQCLAEYKPTLDDCWDNCINLILNSKNLHPIIDCASQASATACADYAPDCFWIIENDSSSPLPNTFKESCKSHNELDFVVLPAFISYVI